MDQKPLEAILSKSLNQATPRFQRILIRTFPNNFTVQYIPGVTNQLVDCLSQLGDQKDTIKLPKLQVNQITQQLLASDSLQWLRLSTQADDELAILKHTIMQGWAKSIKQVPPVLQPFWMFRQGLTVEDGLIVKGKKNHYSTQAMQSHLEIYSWGTLWLEYVQTQSKRNSLLAE